MNLLVEDWGGKIQSHDISMKTGLGVPEILEKILTKLRNVRFESRILIGLLWVL